MTVQKKKVYFIINSLGNGGAEKVVSVLSDKLADIYEVHIITLLTGGFYKRNLKVNYYSLSNYQSHYFLLLLFPYFLLMLSKYLNKYNLIHGVSFLEISNILHILSKKKAIISFRTSMGAFDKSIKGFFYKNIIRVLYPRAEKIIVNSKENALLFCKAVNISTKKIEVLYNPIDLERISILKKVKLNDSIKGKLSDKLTFITVARLISSKQHYKIIDALYTYNKSNTERTYLIVGDGPERILLEHRVKEYGLENKVIFLGRQNNVYKFLANSNLFLYASMVEGFPNVLLEASACNIPIITLDFKTGAQEAITGTYEKDRTLPIVGNKGVILDKLDIEYGINLINSGEHSCKLFSYSKNDWRLYISSLFKI